MLSPLSISRDPSLELMPESLMETYANTNRGIVFAHDPFSNHHRLSQRAILETANYALERAPAGTERTALLLGAGNCLDIPLQEIIDGFDKTTIVEVDHEATERALSDLSARELGKVSLVGADITGIMADFGSAMEGLGEREDRFDAFLVAAEQAVNDINPVGQQPEVGEDFTFVSSQLLLTQLGALPILALSRGLEEKYGSGLSMQMGKADESLLIALNKLVLMLQVDHIRYLAKLPRQDGAIHFADTYAEEVNTRDGTVRMSIVFEEAIQSLIKQDFSETAPRKSWRWSKPGKNFLVVSHALVPKI